MNVIGCGLSVIYSHLLRVEYERYQRECRVIIFRLSFNPIIVMRKRHGIYFLYLQGTNHRRIYQFLN